MCVREKISARKHFKRTNQRVRRARAFAVVSVPHSHLPKLCVCARIGASRNKGGELSLLPSLCVYCIGQFGSADRSVRFRTRTRLHRVHLLALSVLSDSMVFTFPLPGNLSIDRSTYQPCSDHLVFVCRPRVRLFRRLLTCFRNTEKNLLF